MPTMTFRVYTVERIERAADYSVQLTKEEVVSGLKLDANDANKWTEHAEEYLALNWDQIRNRQTTIENSADDNEVDSDIESVEIEEDESV